MNLQKLVKENRFTIAVVFPVVGAVTLLASYEGLLPPFLSYNPYFIVFGTIVMRLPLIAGLEPLLDRRALTGLGILTIYSYLIEYVGTTTGFPYGFFQYGIDLGPMVFGKVPLALPIFFIPLVVNAYLLITLLFPSRSKKRFQRVLMVIFTVIFLDLVLDPGAVAINFWSYSEAFYYGVPLSNYFGWSISATVAVLLLDFSFDREELVKRVENCEFMLDDMVSFVFLWGFVNLYFLNLLPFAFSVVLGLALWKTDRFEFVDFFDVVD